MSSSPPRLIIDMEATRISKTHKGYGSLCHLCNDRIYERYFVSKKSTRDKRNYYHIFCALKVKVIDQMDLLSCQLRAVAAAPRIASRKE